MHPPNIIDKKWYWNWEKWGSRLPITFWVIPQSFNNSIPAVLDSLEETAFAITSFEIPCSSNEDTIALSCSIYMDFEADIWVWENHAATPKNKTTYMIMKREKFLICLSRNMLIRTPLSTDSQIPGLWLSAVDGKRQFLLFHAAAGYGPIKYCRQQNYQSRPINHLE